MNKSWNMLIKRENKNACVTCIEKEMSIENKLRDPRDFGLLTCSREHCDVVSTSVPKVDSIRAYTSEEDRVSITFILKNPSRFRAD